MADWNPNVKTAPREKEILVTYTYNHKIGVVKGEFINGRFVSVEDDYIPSEARANRKILAWMPLPKPYKKPLLQDILSKDKEE